MTVSTLNFLAIHEKLTQIKIMSYISYKAHKALKQFSYWVIISEGAIGAPTHFAATNF